MSRWFLTSFTTGLCLAFAATGCDRPAAPPPYLIGHVVAQTGPGRERGLQAVRGVQLAVEEWNADASNAINGRKLAVLHADTGGDPKLAGPQAARLAGVNKVDALLGGMTRDEWEGIAQIAGDYALIAIGAAGGMNPTASANAFSIGLSPVERVKALDSYIADDLKASSVLILADNRPAYLAAAESLTDSLRRRPVAVELITFSDAENEIPRIIQRLGAAESKTMVVAGPAAAVTAFRSTGLNRDVVFAGEEAELWGLAPEQSLAKGVVFVGAFAPVDADAMKSFMSKFREQFGTAATLDAVAAYDSARLLFRAVKDSSGFATAKLRARLGDTAGFATLAGSAGFGADRLCQRPAYLLRWRDGHPEIIRRLDKEAPPR